MISRIEGQLIAASNGRAELRCNFLTYELLIPAADEQRLASQIGETISFHTLQYMENHGQGAAYIPRLIGFESEHARAFFELFTTVKGIGNRKALRAMQLPVHAIAQAIAERDIATLVTLPEIGKRTAESVIVELSGKVERFIELKPTANGSAASPASGRLDLIQDAVAALVQLGEQRHLARQLIDRVLAADPTIDTAENLIAAAYRLKSI